MRKSFYSSLQPTYPLLIQQFVDDYELHYGVALDIGAGPGHLGIELAKITNMKIIFVDVADEALEAAEEAFKTTGCDNAAEFVRADVRNLPLPDDSADFIMSRGSLWFWEEPEKGLAEIHRVLDDRGVAFIGGGLGRYVPATMRNRLIEENRRNAARPGSGHPTFEAFARKINDELAAKAGLKNYRLVVDDEWGKHGKWFEIRKNG